MRERGKPSGGAPGQRAPLTPPVPGSEAGSRARSDAGGGPPTTPSLKDERPTTERGVKSSGRRENQAKNMLPGRARRRFGLERVVARLIATSGVVGIGVALGAILAASKVQGWITGLVVALLSVILSAVLWSSRQL